MNQTISLVSPCEPDWPGRPLTAAMNEELKESMDIGDFLKKNKENMTG